MDNAAPSDPSATWQPYAIAAAVLLVAGLAFVQYQGLPVGGEQLGEVSVASAAPEPAPQGAAMPEIGREWKILPNQVTFAGGDDEERGRHGGLEPHRLRSPLVDVPVGLYQVEYDLNRYHSGSLGIVPYVRLISKQAADQ